MRILYILPSLANTAPIRIALSLAEYCISCGHTVEVDYFDDKKELIFPCAVNAININRAIEFDAYDIIHSHMRRPDEYVAKNRRLINKARTISTIHCDIFSDLFYSYGFIVAKLYTRKWLRNLKTFHYTVQVSEFLMQKYGHILPCNYLIHNGVSIFKQNINLYSHIIEKIDCLRNQDYKILLSYSSVIKRKGLKQIINALAYRQDLAYICIGEGDERKSLMKLVAKFNLDSRVAFFDFVDYPYNIVPYVDLVVVPSYSESFCLSLHEAGMMGASIVCSNIDAFRDAFTTEEVTFFELNSVSSLLGAIEEALKEKKKEKIILKEKKMYTLDIMLKNYMNLYEKIMNANNEGVFR